VCSVSAQNRLHSNAAGTGLSGMFASAFGVTGRERRSSSHSRSEADEDIEQHNSTLNPMMIDGQTSAIRHHMHPNDQSMLDTGSISSSPPQSNRLFAPTPNTTPVSSGRMVHWGTNISYTSLQQHNPLHGEEPATTEVDLS
jgi:hypothetical protein